MNLLFPDFAVKRNVYESAQHYWEKLVAEAMQHVANSEWDRWFNHEYTIMNHESEAIPVISLVNKSAARGIIINQLNLKTRSELIDGYLSIFGLKTSTPIKLLTVSCVLTDYTSNLTSEVLKTWLNKEVTQKEVDRLLKKPEASLRINDKPLGGIVPNAE